MCCARQRNLAVRVDVPWRRPGGNRLRTEVDRSRSVRQGRGRRSRPPRRASSCLVRWPRHPDARRSRTGRRVDRRLRARSTQSAGECAGASRCRRSRHVQSAAHENRRGQPLRRRREPHARRGVHMALRSGWRASGRRPVGGVRDSSGRSRARRRTEGQADADAVVAQQDLPRHDA